VTRRLKDDKGKDKTLGTRHSMQATNVRQIEKCFQNQKLGFFSWTKC